MPLHDWTVTTGWQGVHLLWMTELVRHLKGRLPAGFRAYLGSAPSLAVDAPPFRPDASVRSHSGAEERGDQAAGAGGAGGSGAGAAAEPDVEVAVATLDPDPSLYVEREGRLVAAVELVSPRNKDRPVARAVYANRYLSYLFGGVHLMLVDVHPRPAGFSFAATIARELQMEGQPDLRPPMAISYRVGEPAATGGRLLGIWRRVLGTGQALPSLPLPLTVELAVEVDLEGTYQRAAADAYLA